MVGVQKPLEAPNLAKLIRKVKKPVLKHFLKKNVPPTPVPQCQVQFA